MRSDRHRDWHKDFYWLRRNKFYSITPFSGLVFINAARNKWESFLWYTIILVFACFTVKNVAGLIEQVRERRTITKMAITKANGSYYFPNSTLCINAKIPDFSPYFYQRWNAYFQREVNGSEFRDINLTESVENALRALPTKERFINGQWKYILLTLAYRYFYFMFASEVQPSVDYTRFPPISDDYLFAPAPFWGDPPAGKETLRFVKHARKLNVSEYELAEKFKQQIWKWFQGAIFYLSNTGQFFVSPMPSRISWMDETRICFGFDFTDIASSVQVRINMKYPAEAMTYYVGEKNFVLLEEYFIKQTSLSIFPSRDVPPVVASLRDGFPELNAPYRQDKEATLRVAASYKTIGSCSQVQTMYECQGQCRSELIEGVCGCRPFTYNQAVNNTCTMEHYLNCLDYDSIMEQPCMAKCQPHCNRKSYSVEEKLLHSTENDDWMTLRISGHTTEYPVFTEEYAQTFETFIGQLGGIIDFWLGASVIGLIHLVVHLIKQVIYCFSSKTTTGRNVRRMINRRRNSSIPCGGDLPLPMAKFSIVPEPHQKESVFTNGFLGHKKSVFFEEGIPDTQASYRGNYAGEKRFARLEKRMETIEHNLSLCLSYMNRTSIAKASSRQPSNYNSDASDDGSTIIL